MELETLITDHIHVAMYASHLLAALLIVGVNFKLWFQRQSGQLKLDLQSIQDNQAEPRSRTAEANLNLLV